MQAIEQAAAWGARAEDWAELNDPHSEPLFEAALDKCRAGRGTELLDVGCGAGRAVQMAAERGARVAGLDASPQMLEIARRRTPSASFRTGDMQELPWPSETFDVVTFFNSLQYASSPAGALREAARVLRADGRLAIAAWAEPEHCDAAPYIAVLGWLSRQPAVAAGPWTLSAPVALRTVLESAGLQMSAMRVVSCPWIYPDDCVALRALMAGGSAARAIEAAGEEAVREAILETIAPFRRRDGSYRLENVFRLAIAGR